MTLVGQPNPRRLRRVGYGTMVIVWRPDISQRGEGEQRKRSGDSCSTSVCSWNASQIPLEHTEMLQESPNLILALLILPPSY